MPDSAKNTSDPHLALAPAKINWTLAVLGKRPDGFHEIGSLVSQVALYDELVFAAGCRPGVSLACDRRDVPVDCSNLVCRAAKLLASRAGRELRLTCRLTKRIPAGGGLGGGSSDAAATLVTLNRIWGLDASKEQLAELAAELGSDVALFLEPGSAVISGRGEMIRPVELGWQGWIVLVIPGLHVSTPAVYRAWRAGGEPPGPVEPRPSRSAEDWMRQTFNMLEGPAIEVCPELGSLQRRAVDMAGRPVRISGSGSTLFTAFDARREAEEFGRSAGERLGVQTMVVQPVEQA